MTLRHQALRAFSALVAVAFAFPAAYLIWRNITTDADLLGLLTEQRTLGPLWRTMRLAIAVTLAASFIGTLLAWLTTRTDLPGARWWRVVLPIPLVFPTFIGAAAFIRTLNPGGLAHGLLEGVGLDTVPELRGFSGAWLVLTLFTYPYVYLPVSARLRRLPGALEENARLLGDTPWQAMRRVVLPQTWGAIAAGSLLVFLYTISDFGAVQLMRYDTLTRAIETNHLARPQVAFALSLFLLLLAAAVVVGERRLANRRNDAPSTRVSRPVIHQLGRWTLPASFAVVVVAALGLGAPLAALGDWAADGIVRATRNGRPLTVDRGKVASAAWHTLESSVLTAIVAVVVVLPVAYLVARRRDRIARTSQAVVVATFAVPGILIALALRFFALRAGWFGDLFFDSKALLIFAYVVRFGSLAIGTVLVAVHTVPDRLHDAASTLGASRLRRLATVDLPLMLPGLGAAAGLVLLSTMKELPISLLIAPLGYSTLTTRIFSSFEESFVAEAGLMAVILVAMSAALSWLLVIRRADELDA